jgi:acyl-CoA synthetase (AMP-forming)/AMP-acid ligase II
MVDPGTPPTAAEPTTARPNAVTVRGLFLDALRTAPARAFLAMEQGTLTYAQAADWSKAVASGLAAPGHQARRSGAIVSTNRPEMVVLWLGCLRLGACFCPLNPGFTGGQLADLFRRVTSPSSAPFTDTQWAAAASWRWIAISSWRPRMRSSPSPRPESDSSAPAG